MEVQCDFPRFRKGVAHEWMIWLHMEALGMQGKLSLGEKRKGVKEIM